MNRAKTLNIKREPSTKLTKKMENMKLYQLPRAMKIKIFPNGESPQRCQLVYAQNFHQVWVWLIELLEKEIIFVEVVTRENLHWSKAILVETFTRINDSQASPPIAKREHSE